MKFNHSFFWLFIFGVLKLIEGTRKIITRSYLLIWTQRIVLRKPELIKGKKAVYSGIGDIVVGVIFMVPFIAYALIG